MIIVNLKGGLGNQMFQYACGRALSLRLQTAGKNDRAGQLKLDTSGFAKIADSITPRIFRLDVFNIKAEIADEKEIKKAKYPFGPISKVLRFFNAKVLRQFYISFNPKITTMSGNFGDIYLDGFFQSEKYFNDFANQIRADFTLRQPLSPVAQPLFDKISRDPYGVSIHIRRGDYVTDKATNAVHGICDTEYYKRALTEISSKIPKPSIYVFSDDIEWAKENIKTGFPTTFVSSPEIADFEELVLMSACRHNVIANSSFSWWSAWLNNNPSKIVIAPTRWANIHNEDWYKDIVPETWKRT